MNRLDDLEDQLDAGQANNSLNSQQIKDIQQQIQRIQVHLDGIPQAGQDQPAQAA